MHHVAYWEHPSIRDSDGDFRMYGMKVWDGLTLAIYGVLVASLLSYVRLGDALFQTHENLEHLAMMERVLGPMPEYMIQKAHRSMEKYLRKRSRLNWPEGAVSRESIRAVKKLNRLKVPFEGVVIWSFNCWEQPQIEKIASQLLCFFVDNMSDIVSRHADCSRDCLTNLLYGLLRFDPSKRLTAQEALDHPFFRNPPT
ncbi:hypothetical protein ACLOJK_019857 [Asimina triloba]